MGKSRVHWLAIHILSAFSVIWVVGSHVPRQESSSIGATPTGSPMPAFSFFNDDSLQPITCRAVNVYWFYDGPNATINLYATNADVPQSDPAPPVSSPAAALPSGVVNPTIPIITVTLGINIDPSIFGFRWSPVNVPQGWYILNASIPSQSYSAQSDSFYVRASNDTSCISNIRTTTTSSLSTRTTTSPPALSTSSPVAVAVGAASQPNAISIGAIIGGTLGLVILIAAIVTAYICCKRNRKNSNRRHNNGEYANRWKELGSADSRGALRGVQPRPYRHQSPNVSLGTVIQSDEGAGAEKSSIHSKLESSALSCEQEEFALSTLPVLKHQPSRSRTFAVDRPQSSSSSTTLGLSSNAHSNHGHSPLPERGPSAREAMSKRRSLDSVAYPPSRSTTGPTPNSNRDQRASIHVLSTRREDSRLSLQPESDAAKQANRQSFGRKRKPVPVYDGEEPTTPPVPSSLPTSPASLSSSPLEPVFSASPTSSSLGHYVTRNRSSIQQSSHPDQVQKGNFGPGAKSLHYLIPDMPIPRQQ